MSALDATKANSHDGRAGARLVVADSGTVPLWTVARRMWVAVTTRNQLAELDERMLHDLGLSRADVTREVSRSPWDTTPVRRGDREI